jgi:hypothetical protein
MNRRIIPSPLMIGINCAEEREEASRRRCAKELRRPALAIVS